MQKSELFEPGQMIVDGIMTDSSQRNASHKLSLSVLMPVYNEEASIESVVNEHLEGLATLQGIVYEWELVCIDDGSTDQTAEILERIASRVSRMRVIRHAQNRGISETLSHLFREARGDYLYITGSDGQWPATILAKLLRSLVATNSDLVIGVRPNRREIYGRWRLCVSYAFNLLPRLLFGVKTLDAGSNKLGKAEIFKFNLISRSPFSEAERIIKAKRKGYLIDFVSIEFLPRSTGKTTGAKWGNIFGSIRDCIKCLMVYRLRTAREYVESDKRNRNSASNES